MTPNTNNPYKHHIPTSAIKYLEKGRRARDS